MKDNIRSARASVAAASRSLGPGALDRLLREWETVLARRVGTVVGASIMNRVLEQRTGGPHSASAGDLASVLERLVDSASVFLSKNEAAGFAAALADAATSIAKEEKP